MTIIVDRYEGDPKLWLDENGAEIVFKGGQSVMDAGLENVVFISLFTRRQDATTKKQWCGNTLFDKPSQQLGGRFLKVADKPLTLTNLQDLESAVKSDLDWMITEQIAKNITARASAPTGDRKLVVIDIEPTGRDIQQIILLKYGTNWIIQKVDPAHKKV